MAPVNHRRKQPRIVHQETCTQQQSHSQHAIRLADDAMGLVVHEETRRGGKPVSGLHLQQNLPRTSAWRLKKKLLNASLNHELMELMENPISEQIHPCVNSVLHGDIPSGPAATGQVIHRTDSTNPPEYQYHPHYQLDVQSESTSTRPQAEDYRLESSGAAGAEQWVDGDEVSSDVSGSEESENGNNYSSRTSDLTCEVDQQMDEIASPDGAEPKDSGDRNNHNLASLDLTCESDFDDNSFEVESMEAEDTAEADEWFDAYAVEEFEYTDQEWFDCKGASDDDHAKDFEEDAPLFEGAPITLAESMLLILLYATRHSLTGVALVDLLTLVSLHCLVPNLCVTSLYMFKKFFGQLKSPVIVHKFCNYCQYLLSDVSGDSTTCPVCAKDTSSDGGLSYFIEIPIIQQLATLLGRKDFYNNLQHRFKREKRVKNNIEDIYDGLQYRKHSEPGHFLADKNNISLMWYTDGCPLFKSSKRSLWPLFFAINELPYKKRFLKENLLYAGLWVGGKPAMATFMKPFHDSLTQLQEGVLFHVPSHKQKVLVKAMVLCGTCDLPARCIMLNMTQFNGAYGCTHCLQKGSSAAAGRGSTWTYPFMMVDPCGPKRTHKSLVEGGAKASDANTKPVRGVKGHTFMSYTGIDLVNGTAVDYMHTVLLGISKKLMHLWFDTKHSRKLFSLSKFLPTVDERLLSIKPPHFISRVPRSIKDHLAYWKASEYRSWLFYYSLPVLADLMDALYLNHYVLFVEAIVILNGTSISMEDVRHCERLLYQFGGLFGTLYGDRYMTAVVHSVVHLADVVRNLGPLWVYSCFAFEDANGKLLNMVKGTQTPELQIASNLSRMLKIPELLQNINQPEPFLEFVRKLTAKKHTASNMTFVNTSFSVVGAMKRFDLDATLVQLVAKCTGSSPEVGYKFHRLFLRDVLYQSSSYTFVSKRNSYTVCYVKDGSQLFGHIRYFMKCKQDCDCVASCTCSADFVAVLRYLPILSHKIVEEASQVRLNHIATVSLSADTLHVIGVEDIMELCVFAECRNNTEGYVIKMPNRCESD